MNTLHVWFLYQFSQFIIGESNIISITIDVMYEADEKSY